jgi:N-6 DNA methylase
MMSGSTTLPAGIPSPTDPEVVALIDRWVDAATQGGASTIAGVVGRIARARGLRVALVVDGVPVEEDAAVAAMEAPEELLQAAGPWLPGFMREALLAPADRRRVGVHHTTPAMAGALLDFTMEFHPFDTSTVVADPAVGGGVFLLAACERLPGSRQARVAQVQGFDIDPLAVAVTRASLQLWAGGAEVPPGSIRVADALSSATFDAQPNVVVGNPPFLSQMRDETTRGEEQRAELRRRWPDVGGYVDDAAAFLLAAVDEVADGGVVSLVQPSSFLSARDAAPVRQRLMREAPPVGLWIDGDRQFDAAVDTVAVIVRKAAAPAPVRRSGGVPVTALATHTSPLGASSWASLLLDDSTPQIEPGELARSATVGDVAHVTAGFRDHFYGLRGAVTDNVDGRHRLITSGLIDPLECRWGVVPCRFDRQRWSHPTVDPDAVAPGIRDWIANRFRPKLLLASQTRVIEVAIDRSGRMVPGTPVVSVEPAAEAPSLAHLAAALTSPVVALVLVAEAAGSALSRDAVRVAAPTIAALPLPVEGPEWDAAAAAVDALGEVVHRIELIEIARLGMAAYGVADRDDILNWWQERLPRR